MCCPAEGASCLSAEYTWQQLVPDLAALVRRVCVAVEAWPPGAPTPQCLETGPDTVYTPLALQYMVRPSQPAFGFLIMALALARKQGFTRLTTECGT